MATTKQIQKTSKFLSLILRHKPGEIGLVLDANGWANLDELITKANASREIHNLDRTLIEQVVSTNDKKRFVISDDGEPIQANQGHSINVDLPLNSATPPIYLYHGTATRFLDSILRQGLRPQQRQHVHLSTDIVSASAVGRRYGKPVILKIKALLMHEQGFVFYRSANGVWLTKSVPACYLEK